MNPSDCVLKSARRTAVLLLLLFPLMAMAATSKEPRFITHQNAVANEYIVALPADTPGDRVDAIASVLARDYGLKIIRTFHDALSGFHCRATARAARRLSKDARVVFVEENYTMPVTSPPPAPVQSEADPPTRPWGRHRITHRDRITSSTTLSPQPLSDGKGIVAYIFDTGVLRAHEEFDNPGEETDKPRVQDGHDTFTSPQDQQPPTDPCGRIFSAEHGTSVASLLGGKTLGVAPAVTIVPVRVSDCGGHHSLDRVVAGIDWILKDDLKTHPHFRGAVLNMSFEQPPEVNPSFKAALQRAADAGIVAFAAAGNFPDVSPGNGDSCTREPAGYGYGVPNRTAPHVIVASGIDDGDHRRACRDSGSSEDPCGGREFGYGQCVDIFAPATDVVAAAMDSDPPINARRSVQVNGTSFASPLTAGAAAILMQNYNLLNGRETTYNVWRMLRDTATRGVVLQPGLSTKSVSDPQLAESQRSPDRLLYIGAIKILGQPDSITVGKDSTRPRLTVTAEGGGTYQWYEGGYDALRPISNETNDHFDAPTSEASNKTYWVRVTQGTKTADSMPFTVSVCNTANDLTRPTITQTQSGNSWNLSVNSGGVDYEWYVGAPGDTSRRVPGSASTINVTPVTTTDYWVRVRKEVNGCFVDSADYVTVNVCKRPTIALDPESHNVGYVIDQIPRPTQRLTFAADAGGSELVYQWYRFVNGVPQAIPGATHLDYTVPFSEQEQLIYATATSRCNGATAETKRVTVRFTLRTIETIFTHNPNTPASAPDQEMENNFDFLDIRVPRGRGVALTARPRAFPSMSAIANIRWTDFDGTKTVGDTRFFQNVIQDTNGRQVDAAVLQDDEATPHRTRDLAVCGNPLVLNNGLIANENDHLYVTLREADHPIVEWRRGPHDDRTPPLLSHFANDKWHLDEPLAPGTSYWARVIADCFTDNDDDRDDRTTEDTPLYTTCSLVTVRHPVTREDVPLSKTATMTVYVADGGQVALTANSNTPVVWRDANGSHPFLDYLIQNVHGTRTITVESPADCVTGTVSVEADASCPRLIQFTSPDVSISGNATAQITVALGNISNPTIEWREGPYDAAKPQLTPLPYDEVNHRSTLVAAPGKSYWARIITSCNGKQIVEDSRAIAVGCTDCRHHAANGRTRVIRVNGAPSTSFPKSDDVPVTLQTPDEFPGDTYEWRHGIGGVHDSNEPPFSRASLLDDVPVGEYWVRTKDPDGFVFDSSTTKIVPANISVPAQVRIRVHVFPEGHFIGVPGQVSIVAEKPDACDNSLQFTWWQGRDYNDPAKVKPYDEWGDASSLELYHLADTATFWLEAHWKETAPGGQCNVEKDGLSELIEITVICDPPSGVTAMASPSDHVGKNELVTLSGGGVGKLLTYRWYMGTAPDKSSPDYEGRVNYKVFTHDTDMWVEGTDDCGNVSNAQLNIYVCRPTITLQPPAMTVIRADQTIVLRVEAEPAQSGQTVTYQWFRSDSRGFMTQLQGETAQEITVSAPGYTYWCEVRGTCFDPAGTTAMARTRDAHVEVCAPPTIVRHSPSRYVRANELQTLTVEATGTDLTYQWYRGANPITDATGSEYTVVGLQETATFWVRVASRGVCTADSEAITLTIVTAPQITAGPAANPGIVFSGGTSTLSVSATGTEPLTFVWYEVTELGNVLVGEQPSIITEPLTAPKTYFCRITAASLVSIDTPQITVSVCAFPQSIPPAPDVQVSAGVQYLLTLPALDPAEGNTITWYRGASGDVSTPVQTGESRSLLTSDTALAQYWAKVERNGCVSSTPTTHVYVCVPRAAGQPAGASIIAGQSHTMTFNVTGTDAPVTYQWYAGEPPNERDPIPGQTSASMTVTPMTTTTYFCRAMSNCGRYVDSNAVTVNVCARPVIDSAYGMSIAPGQAGHVMVNASGANLTYQWYRGASGNTAQLIPGADGAMYVESPAVTSQYWCRVTSDNSCSVDSATLTIDVCSYPTITTQPADVTIAAGQTAQFSVAATGATGYQWYSGDGTLIGGATNATYTTPVLNADATYKVRALNGLCWTESRTATVTACNLSVGISSGGQIARGQVVTLSSNVVNARGTNLTYTWYIGPTGNTSQVWTTGPASIAVGPQNTTQYWLRVTDGSCTADSNPATVDVCRPQIATHPAGTSIDSGQTATLSVAADIAGVTVQWYKGATGDVSVPSGTGATVNVNPTTSSTYWARATGSCGYADSNAALVCVRPVITATSGASIAPGYAANITVIATGAALSYQWYVGASGVTASPIPDSNAPNRTVNPTTTTNYWCRVTSSGTCWTDSPTITVNVCTNPSITTQPANATINSGQSTTLSVAASPATGYQWYRGASGDTSAPTGTTATFNTGALTADTQYWVRVSNGLCTTNSNAATVTVCQLSVNVNGAQTRKSETATLTAGVSNARSQNLSYTWYVGSSGDTSQLYQSGPASIVVAPQSTTNYWVRVSDGICTANSNTATVNVCIPRITTQPTNRTISPGTATTLTVVSDLPGSTYQWFIVGGTNVPLSTTASLTVTPGTTSTYWVRVTGTCGQYVDSTWATVTLCTPPTVSANPNTYYIIYGQSTTIGVNGQGNNLTYQWYNGASGVTTSPISGQTNYSLSVAPTATSQYWCRVTSDGVCTANSPTITVDVCTSPSITAQPASATIASGQSANLSVTATSSGAMTYQWYRGASGDTSNPVSNATSAAFNTGALTADTQYWVRITRGACYANSNAATITVCGMSASISSAQSAAYQTVTLSSSLNGARSAEPYYTWYAGPVGNTSSPVGSGVNKTSVQVAPATTTQYWLRVDDTGCSANSNAGTVDVCYPTITSQPANALVTQGQSTTLTVGTTGSGLIYQWYAGASTPVGTNSPSLTVSPSSTTSYWCFIRGCNGSNVSSNSATVTVCTLPTVPTPIADMPVTYNQLMNVRVDATGTNLTYQWYKGPSGNTSTPVASTSSVYTFYAQQTDLYWVRVGSSCGSVDSAAVYASVRPSFYVQPQSQTVVSGSSVTLTAAASGTYLSYQWYNNMAQPINGATSGTYVTGPLTSYAAFYCVAVSGTGQTMSQVAGINVCQGPNFYYYRTGSGPWYTLTVSPYEYGVWDLAYDWYQGQPGDTSHFLGRGYYYMYVAPSTATTYWVRVWNPEQSCYRDSTGITVP